MGLDGTSTPKGVPPNVTHVKDTRLTNHLYLKQTHDGKIISGGDRIVSDPQDSPDKPINDELNFNNKQFAENILPFLKDEEIVDTWTGLMPFTPDGKPLIGKIEVF